MYEYQQTLILSSSSPQYDDQKQQRALPLTEELVRVTIIILLKVTGPVGILEFLPSSSEQIECTVMGMTQQK